MPDVAEELRGVDAGPRPAPRTPSRGWLAREQAGLDALRSRPALADPRTLLDARADEVDAAARPRPPYPRPPRSTGPPTTSATSAARARALSPLATLQRGYAVLQDADGHVVTSVAGPWPGAAVSVRVADGRIHATTTRTEHRPR